MATNFLLRKIERGPSSHLNGLKVLDEVARWLHVKASLADQFVIGDNPCFGQLGAFLALKG